MAYFPISLELDKRKVLVAGGGKLALHKIRMLLAYGASVICVSLDFCEGIRKMAEDGTVCLKQKEVSEEIFSEMEKLRPLAGEWFDTQPKRSRFLHLCLDSIAKSGTCPDSEDLETFRKEVLTWESSI